MLAEYVYVERDDTLRVTILQQELSQIIAASNKDGGANSEESM